ncbi:hypothetical protein FYT70_19395 [Salmonella enterica subsp. enterica]|uniref:hypothetical protein n=1 Tax=Enterobacter ludwigii TaxID=299767 RepID=UPI00107881C6|nr:hypothetical protein [Salmonella enterica]ECA4762680.1 hypothetical protein [Salmonella enterica subsp. enterica serovar Kirkee]ECW7105705.1 hypothetical protein [Salmonella enterica subsp. enterica serovar Virchow]HBV8254555.1 hypothetical protein [Escherichia coli]HDR2684306.1 hypothetical protein [Enterobacter ludwigii]
MIKEKSNKLLAICMVVLYLLLVIALTVCLKITPAFHFKDILLAILMLVVILFPWVIIGAKMVFDKED